MEEEKIKDLINLHEDKIEEIYLKHHVNPFNSLAEHNKGIMKAIAEFAIFYKNVPSTAK